MRIAFIGLGNMGSGMAANQAKAGREVHAYDVVKSALDRSSAVGCKAARSVPEAVDGADIVITMLPAGKHVRAVYGDEVFPKAKTGALLIDCSTIDVDSARAVAKQAKEAGFRFADAPVSGGTLGADAGTLTFMVGCEESDFTDVEEALKPMAKAIIHAGSAGAGQAAKICNNMILGITMIGTCEAFALAEKLGLDLQRFFDISSKSSGQSWSMTTYCPVPGPVPAAPSNKGYAGGFATAMMLKDLKLAQDAAMSSGAVTPMGSEAMAQFSLFERLGYGGKDFSAIIQMLRGHLDELN